MPRMQQLHAQATQVASEASPVTFKFLSLINHSMSPTTPAATLDARIQDIAEAHIISANT